MYFTFNDKREGLMNDSVRGLERRGLAQGLKVFLGVFFFLILAAGVLSVVALSISTFTDYDDGWEFDVPVAVGEGSFYTRLPSAFVQDTTSGFLSKGISQAQGKLVLHHYSLPLHLGNTAMVLLFYGALLWGITLLRRILATTAGGRPFDPLNPGRLNTLGWIILLSSALASLLQYVASRWVLSRFEATNRPPLSLHRFPPGMDRVWAPSSGLGRHLGGCRPDR
jgi:hypothetical protein